VIINNAAALERLRVLDRERMHLNRAAAVLQWDQETYLPSGGVENRAEQLAILEGLAHEKLISAEVGELLDRLITDTGVIDGEDVSPISVNDAAGFPARDFLRVLRRDHGRAVKLPADFVRECARAEGLSQAAWVKARQKKDFSAFAPYLETMISLARKKAEYWGWGRNGRSVYDGLLDLHEPGLGVADIAAVFSPLREKLHTLLKKIAARSRPESAFLHRRYEIPKQDAFCREVLAGIGFDFNRGRLDLSAHPFTTTLGFNDVRITTRYTETNPLSGLFSVIHEGGHAFYELGLAPDLRFSCLAEGASMGIHESQSRLWENVIGRSRAFWQGWFPRLKACFPSQMETVGFDDFYRAMNTAAPSPVRVEADEVSYSLHIVLRFDLEERIFAGKLTVNELPAAWNAAMEEYLGLRIADDAEGVLQDVHWSMGAFGYFPSYALGNLYGLQFWEKLTGDIPNVEAALEKREYGEIHRWLREKIHHRGRCTEPAALLREVTGKGLSVENFLNYIERKYTELYGL
jgi:carboxypeptidase Taq